MFIALITVTLYCIVFAYLVAHKRMRFDDGQINLHSNKKIHGVNHCRLKSTTDALFRCLNKIKMVYKYHARSEQSMTRRYAFTRNDDTDIV